MAYTVMYRPAAQRDIRGLERRISERIIEKIGSFADEPRPHGVKKLAGEIDMYRVRVGAFRIIYHISDANEMVTIARVSDRKDAY